MNKRDRIMRGAAEYAAFYRLNPARFAKDYLHLDLKLFQKILLTMMVISSTFVFIGARGIGKSFISAIFCVIKCILWPGSKICIASATRGQSINVLEKIMLELKPRSLELALEIDDKESKMNGTNAIIVFKNGSYIKCVTASDTSRGNRATVLILDEFRLISKDVIDTVLKKFLTQRRMPPYYELTKSEREVEYDKEKNMSMYLSSAYTTDHWSYNTYTSTSKAMINGIPRQFACALPYQLSLAERLLDRDTVADEMLEPGFSDVKFAMEYEALWWGSGEDSFFDFDSISKNRRIQYPMLPDKLATKLNNSALVKIVPKQKDEIRIISADIALMTSKKNRNDATAIFINRMLPTKAGRYISNIVYADAYEGLRTDDQALVIRKLFDEYQCDYIALDTQGLGLGVADALMKEIPDPDAGQIYPALSCYNDKTMAERCTSPKADKVIWSIKANSQFNSDIAFALREAFRSGRVRLLAPDDEADQYLSEVRGYNQLTLVDKALLRESYGQTSLLVNELVQLQHDENGGKVRLFEKSGMRKDRYSSLAYNYYVATQIEAKINKKRDNTFMASDTFLFRAPKIK